MRLDEFLALPAPERSLYFGQAAGQRGLSAAVMEKDFWVCWLLKLLFESPYAEHLIFKGGTSLSKVFGAIERFSEDIDLAIAAACLGVEPPESPSKKQLEKYQDRADVACAGVVNDGLRPWLEATVAARLDQADASWFRFVNEGGGKSPTLLFDYPRADAANAGLTPFVKLEFGWRTERWAIGPHAIEPWLREVFPQAMDDWHCQVMAMDVERTFWEKATILHAEHYRPATKDLGTSMSRHYYDVAMLASRGLADRALADDELRGHVVEWKERLFRSSWSNYALATPGSFRLLPREDQMRALRQDYAVTRREMVFDPDAPDFDGVMAILGELERRINHGGTVDAD